MTRGTSEAALAVRAIVAAPTRFRHDHDVDSALQGRFCAAATNSTIEEWVRRNFDAEPRLWRPVSPFNGYEFTVERLPFVTDSGGSEIRVRCKLLLPRGGMSGLAAPRLLVDLIVRDVPAQTPDGAPRSERPR